MTIDQFQFYPTPLSLAKRAWDKFKNRNFVRVLEPHAGNGDLAMAAPFYDDYRGWRGDVKVDCCEIDMSRHATLRDKALNVVGMDFLEYGSASLYSHIVMNPPFAQGCKHVLKAFDALWNGEVVAIIGAETLRNPYSKERQHLVKLIEKYGDVEYLSEEFMTDETQRKTRVEIALVRLEKRPTFKLISWAILCPNSPQMPPMRRTCTRATSSSMNWPFQIPPLKTGCSRLKWQSK